MKNYILLFLLCAGYSIAMHNPVHNNQHQLLGVIILFHAANPIQPNVVFNNDEPAKPWHQDCTKKYHYHNHRRIRFQQNDRINQPRPRN